MKKQNLSKKIEDKKGLLKIGEVAKINHITIYTLRYYDEIGLFPADFVDQNGYRYYRPESLLNLDLILWLRSDGLPLSQIKEIVHNKSLDGIYRYMNARKEKIEQEMQKLKQQLDICKIYCGRMNLLKEYPESIGYFLSFEKRWCIRHSQEVDPSDRDGYELKLKELFEQYTNKFYYYNSFFGGIYSISQKDKQREDWTQRGGTEVKKSNYEFYPAIYNFGNPDHNNAVEMPAGIYAIIPVYGYYDKIVENIPIFLEFIQEHHYRCCSDCYAFKIWEQGDCHEQKEVMELQILVEKI